MVQFNYSYVEESSYKFQGNSGFLKLETDQNRTEKVKFRGKIEPVLEYRDSMLCLRDIVTSNYIKPVKTRYNYKSWLNSELDRLVQEELSSEGRKKQTSRIESLLLDQDKLIQKIAKKIKGFKTKKLEVQRFLIEKQMEKYWRILDPVISVHPETIIFEALSLDESSYANLSVPMDKFLVESATNYGTTNIDFSKKLCKEFHKIRSSNELYLEINLGGLTLESGSLINHVEKKIDLPETWVIGFLQVTCALSLPALNFSISRNDLYSIITFLKGHKANSSPRALRFDLNPGNKIKVIFEPWNSIIELDSVYSGSNSTSIRVWGRRRILLLERLLPHIKSINVRLIGKGMPMFFQLHLNNMIFSLGLSSWIKNNWSRGLSYSSIFGHGYLVNPELENFLKEFRSVPLDELYERFTTEGDGTDSVQNGLSCLYRKGKAFFDINTGTVRYRELSSKPFPDHITNLSSDEQKALAYLEKIKESSSSYQVITEENSLLINMDNQDTTEENRRSWRNKYKISLRLSHDGLLLQTNCTCGGKKKKKSICEHILALYIDYTQSRSD